MCSCYGDVVCVGRCFNGACGVGVSDVYMLKSVGDCVYVEECG